MGFSARANNVVRADLEVHSSVNTAALGSNIFFLPLISRIGILQDILSAL